MTISKPALLVTALITLLLAFPVFADEESAQATSEQILAHPEVKGALTAIDAFIEAVQIYDKVPGISAGIVSDQDLIWKKATVTRIPRPNGQQMPTRFTAFAVSVNFLHQ